ncbi:MAG: glycosyltransferase, partial [Candidatus Rokubacteria bacterium]|nr:glycosyltransferase [Candidatus Rokubacteria bacterium]
HEEALDYLRIPGRLAVIPSRLENSPYTVLECLGAGICLISADVGGIRELIHGDDRPRVLFKGEELAAKLREALDEGASPARPAVDLDSVRERWVRWHETELAALEGPGPVPGRPLAPARPRSLGVCVLADAPPLWDRWAQECATIAGRADGLFGAPAEALQASESEFLLIATATTHVDPRFVARGMRVLDTTGASMVTSVAYHRWPFRRRYRPGSPLFFPIPAAACVAAFRPVLGDHALLVRRGDCAKAIRRLDDRPEMSIWGLALEWTLAGLRLEVMPEPWLGTPLMPSLDPPRGQTAHRQRVDALSRRMPVALDGLFPFVHRLHKRRARSSPAAWPARGATA